MPTYNRLPVSFRKGEGAWLWDVNGSRYLDALSGIAVCGLGHCHPAVSKAIIDQAEKLLHTSNLYGIEHQQELAEALTELSGLDNVFFCNSGAEANEAAIKIARAYGQQQGIQNPAIIVMDNSFHGRTLATLSATGNPTVHKGFEPLVQGFVRVPYNSIPDIEAVALENQNVVAILVEPIQGEGGIHIPHPNYLKKLREICDKFKWLLMLDEVQTGIGRTGKFCAFQHSNLLPDVCTLAKALGNGVPIGACLAKGVAANLLTAGTHGSTFGGNPLACSAALAVIDTIQKDNLISRAAKLGDYLTQSLHEKLQHNTHIVEIRGKGLMIGIELDQPCIELVKLALEHKLLINVTADNTIRLLPPLVFTNKEADVLSDTLALIIDKFTDPDVGA